MALSLNEINTDVDDGSTYIMRVGKTPVKHG